jgi:hypothetical protein
LCVECESSEIFFSKPNLKQKKKHLSNKGIVLLFKVQFKTFLKHCFYPIAALLDGGPLNKKKIMYGGPLNKKKNMFPHQ